MKTALTILLAAALGFTAASLIVSRRAANRHAAQLAEQQAAWLAEKTDLEAALERARNQASLAPIAAVPAQIVQVTNLISPTEIIEWLKTLKVVASQPRSVRLVLYQLESLIKAGPAALPAIRGFLALNQDIEYDGSGQRGLREGKISTEFTLPPSLRLGLLEVAMNIGGDAGEQLLADVLGATGRGVEVAYTAYALQELAPGKYRDTALAAAHQLLTRPSVANAVSPLDKFDRDYLYGLLSFFNDGSYSATAQAQLVQPTGQVDRTALRYLQQTLGAQSVAIAAQAWQDARIPADQREPLARVALAYAGANPQANELYATAITDLALPKDHRRELIEDLNQDGFADKKNLTANDLPLIDNRIRLIEQLAPNNADPVNDAAFKEAYNGSSSSF